ncbi:MAG TPA: hypothetical protein VMT34_02680 [Aggregatilineales bacterium]|nr:hypothetical protein [Aggregatilineales bacterium]
MPTLEIGFGEQDITPQPGTVLSGFIFRENRPSTHVDDPLHVRVLTIRHQNEVFTLVNYELLGISPELEEHLLAALEEVLKPSFSRDRAVLVATHTHSAPPASPLEGEADTDPQYRDFLCRCTIQAARSALQQLQLATLHVASLWIPGHTYNRRGRLVDGRVTMALTPDVPVLERGPVDDTLTALVWRNTQGRNIAGIVHFACHGVAVCAQGLGGDIPGEVARRAASLLGAPCMFLQGAAGDINPTVAASTHTDMLKWMDDFVPKLARLPVTLYPVPSLPFRAVSTVVPLDYQPLPPRAAVIERIKNFERIAGGDVDSPDLQNTLRRLGNIMNFAPGQRPDVAKAAYASQALANAERRTLAAIDSARPLAPCPMRLAAWQIGQITMVFASAELFALTGFQIRASGSGQAMLPVTYAAPIVGYVPDSASMGKGGYEVDDAWRFYRHPAPFQPDSVDRILAAVGDLNAALKNKAGE